MATLHSKKKEERRAASHNVPQTLPDRTGNAPWTPPHQHARAASATLRQPMHLAPLAPPAEIHRKPVARESSPITLAPSETSSPHSRSPSSYSSQAGSPYRTLPPQHAQTLPVPGTSLSGDEGSPTSKGKRKSWFGSGGGKLTKGSKDIKEEKLPAWIVGFEGQRPPYDVQPLLHAQKVPELWNPQGNTFVYLFPRTSGYGPSFCVDSSIFSSSSILTELAFGRVYSQPIAGASTNSLSRAQRRQQSMDFKLGPGSRTTSPAPFIHSPSNSNTDPSEDSLDSRGLEEPHLGPVHLYLPISLSADGGVSGPDSRGPSLTGNDIDTLISVRNLFAFLLGQSIIGTERRGSTFNVFLKVAELLVRFGFSNLDGSTFGEVANSSFDSYVEELRINDVRGSREKTIEGIILGEKMRSVLLYNETFVHGVGKWDDIHQLQSPKFDMISNVTKTRMERAALDLESRKRNIKLKLEEFDFPGMFAGIMDSKTAHEAKTVRFNAWRESFMTMRKWFINYYRHKYGAWPPKASSKKNALETNGLNRLVLRDLYQDLSDLYDLLVDRTQLTTRTTDMVMDDDDTEDVSGPLHRALRKVLNEYDRSTPPVQPPVPFDVPLVPSIALIGDEKADIRARTKKLKKDPLGKILNQSYNPRDPAKRPSPFVEAFKEFEFTQAARSTIGQISDLRQGEWLFLYAVLQSMPMLVVDAPALKWTQGVEYFLCMPPRSGVPWANNNERERTYYTVPGSNNAVVSLPSDVIEFGVEGIYRRSHCWKMAEQWTADNPILNEAIKETMSDLPAPPILGDIATPRSRSNSPSGRNRDSLQRRSVMLSGLEALPMPPGVFADSVGTGVGMRTPPGSSSPIVTPRGSPKLKPISHVDTTKTFDAILGSIETSKKKK